MLPVLEMRFYYRRKNGKVIVQNAAMGMLGQEHTHTEENFVRWSKDIPKHCLIDLDS